LGEARRSIERGKRPPPPSFGGVDPGGYSVLNGEQNAYQTVAGSSDHADVLNSTAQNQIRSIIERVERLEQEKAEISEQVKEVYAEAKGNGFDVKVLRQLVRLRKVDRAKRLEMEAILDLYMQAVGEV
jgi:uncharacterized protein (UPF0335 family)